MKAYILAILLISNFIGCILILILGYKSVKYFRIIKINVLFTMDSIVEIFNRIILYSNFVPLLICLMIITSFFKFKICEPNNKSFINPNSEDSGICKIFIFLIFIFVATIFIFLFMGLSSCCKKDNVRYSGFFIIMFINLITFISCFFESNIYILYNIIEMILSLILFFLNFYFIIFVELKICQKNSKNYGTITTKLIPNEVEENKLNDEVNDNNKNLLYNNEQLTPSEEAIDNTAFGKGKSFT